MALSTGFTLAELLSTLPQVGRLEWIGVRPGPRAPMRIAAEAEMETDTGLIGDRSAKPGAGKRQVTLIQAEHLPVIAALSGHEQVPPEWLRRNLVVSGINLLALHNRRFSIGDVLLEGTGHCQPCSRMEEALGPGGYNAMRGHGGITARVLQGGTVTLGAAVRFVKA